MSLLTSAIEIEIERRKDSTLSSVDFNNIPFGKTFSDHMMLCEYYNGQWQSAKIQPFQNLSLSPACNVFHYGQAIFEGMKAFYKEDGSGIVLFRPDKNIERMNKSAVRMSMPEIPQDLFMEGLLELVRMDKDFVPNLPNSSLYIRPVLIGTEASVGVKTSDRYLFYIIVGPSGAYYGEPISLLVYESYIRATKGGYGFAKAAGNYAGTLQPVELARKQGYKDVLWLDGEHKKYAQEAGTMNVFFVIDGKLVTPKVDGTILDGVTRGSVIQLAKDFGIEVQERDVSIEEIVEFHNSGKLTEIFGTGTAVVINPVSRFGFRGKDHQMDVDNFVIAPKLKKELEGIQKGVIPDRYNWLVEI